MKKLSVLLLMLVVGGLVFAGAGAQQGAGAAAADNYPNKPIRLIIGNAGGGAVETICRRWQPYAEKELGVPLQFDFIEGAGGIIATNVLRNAPPDGYTFFVQTIGNMIICKLLLEADWQMDDFDFLTRFSNDPGVLLVKKDAPYNDLNEFVNYVRTRPPKSVSVSVAAITDPNFLGIKLINEAYGIELNPVGYTSGGQARLAVVRGEVAASHANWFGASAIWSETKAIAIHQAKNNVPALQAAKVKTVNEQVGKTVPDISTKYAIVLPKGFFQQYPARAQKLYDCLTRAWSNPEFVQGCKDADLDGYMEVLDAEATAAEVKAEDEMYTVNVKYFEL